MNFYTIRDLRTRLREVLDKLTDENEVIITNNGKPSALMIELDDENFEEVLADFGCLKTMRAINKLRLASIRNGKPEMSLAEINAEISEHAGKIKNTSLKQIPRHSNRHPIFSCVTHNA